MLRNMSQKIDVKLMPRCSAILKQSGKNFWVFEIFGRTQKLVAILGLISASFCVSNSKAAKSSLHKKRN